MLTYYYIYDIVEPMLMEAITNFKNIYKRLFKRTHK